jgi:hypothetical protein
MTRALAVVLRWLGAPAQGYRARMGQDLPVRRVSPVARPSNLDSFEGMWVAVVDDVVIEAEFTSHQLALKLHGMDHRKRRRAVIEFVRPSSDAYIVGVG